MRRLCLRTTSFEHDPTDLEGFRAGQRPIGDELGAQDSGATAFSLPPGQAICPYHYELGEEEWLLVLAGEATVRTPEGTERMGPHELAFFPRGPLGAHEIRNDGEATVRVLLWSTVVRPTATVYPDSDKVGVWTGEPEADGVFRRASRVGYYQDEPPRPARGG